jgi:two-component system, OmpR family, sensor kinase
VIQASSLRFRMMVLFCVTVGVLLAGTYAIIYSIFDRALQSQLDRRLLDTAGAIVADLQQEPDKSSNALESDISSMNLPGQYLELVEPTGEVVQFSPNLRSRILAIHPSEFDPGHHTFQTLDDRELGRLRFSIIPFSLDGSQLYLVIGVPTRDIVQTLASFRRLLLTLLPLSLLVTALMSAWYTGRGLKPVVDLTQRAAQFTQRLSDHPTEMIASPLPISNSHDEVGRLATSFNELYDALIAALSQLRQFVSDASHEIRTPLAVLRGETELLLSKPRKPDEYQTNLRVIDSELKKLDRIVDGLFTLSMADAGQLRLAREKLYLDDVLEEACQLALKLAQAKSIKIERDFKHQVSYEGDEVFLRQLFMIFLDNAIKYSPQSTRIKVRLECKDASIEVRFVDEGDGIAEQHLPHIFKRFYRAANPDTGEGRSGGLGLAIAQAIVRAHGGQINCETSVGSGSTFSVVLPSREWEASYLPAQT